MKTLVEPTKELLEACKNGNQQAFREIFYTYRTYAYNLIYKITGKTNDFEDLLQDLFFQVYLSLKTFRGDSSFSTWFHRVVIHVCTSRWRYQQAKKRISSHDMVDLESVEHSVSNPEYEHGNRYELKELVEKALNTLNENLRVPLVLNVYSDMDLTEIADVLGLPEGTIKSRLFTARKKVKEYLDSMETR
jgi:RNA polymerase sigma-70 factor, ECF subfamily